MLRSIQGKKRNATYLFILGSLLLGSMPLIFGNIHQPGLISVFHQKFSYILENQAQTSPPILIESDEQFSSVASSRQWQGDGSSSNPYIISNLRFPEESNPIRIFNTQVHVLIVNNTFSLSNDAIYLENVDHVVIHNNTITDVDGSGIILNTCKDIKILRNLISNSNQYSIKTINTQNLSIESNIIQNSGSSAHQTVSLKDNFDVDIIGNILSENYGTGFYLDNCTNSLISFNEVTRNDFSGIEVMDSVDCSILSNELVSVEEVGVSMTRVSKTLISNNNIQSSNLEGFSLNSLVNCTVSKNFLSSCETGVSISDSSDSVRIFDNTIQGSSKDGMYFFNSNNSLLSSNTVINNDGYGIRLEDCENNTVRWNDFINNNGSEIQGFSSNNNVIPHVIEHNCWNLANDSFYLLEGNANSNDSIPHPNYCQLLSDLDFTSEYFGLSLLLGWDLNDTNSWNLTYTVSISPNAGNDWIKFPDLRNNSITCDFTNYSASYNYIIKILGRSEKGVFKVAYSEKFSYYNRSCKVVFHSPKNAQGLREISTISWEYRSGLSIGEVYYNIYISQNNITWLLVQAWIFENTYQWNTINFEEGDYFLKISSYTHYELLQESFFEGKFEIDNHYINDEPVLISLDEGEILSGIVFLSWTESVDSKGYPVTYNLYYSLIGGWEPIAMNLSSTSYYWDTTTVRDGSNYRIRIEARGGLNEYINFESGISFTIENVSPPPLETAFILVLVVAVLGLISVVYLLRRRLSAVELALKVKELTIGFCLGTFTDKGLKIQQKNDECPYDEISLISALEYGAVLAQRSKYKKIYGPFPHPVDQNGIEWYNVIYGFKINDPEVSDARIIKQHGETPALLLIYYPGHFDVLFMMQKQKIENYLLEAFKETNIKNLSLEGFDNIYKKIRQILLDYKPLEMDLVLDE